MLRSAGSSVIRVWAQAVRPAWQDQHRLFGSKPQKKIEEPLQNPLVYSGPVYYIDTQERVEHWCKIIKEQVAQMAIDAEWRPEFKRNQNHPLALLQLCFRNAGRLVVVLVHLKYTGVPKNLANILQDEMILKIGANLLNDAAKLRSHHGVQLKGVFDLAWSNNKVLRGNLPMRGTMGIRQLVQRLLGKEMRKSGKWTRSNWERKPLQRQQVEYAALDVYATMAVYEEMKRREEDPDERQKQKNKDGDPLEVDADSLLLLQKPSKIVSEQNGAHGSDFQDESGKGP